MKIEEIKNRIRCEMPNCKGLADYKIHKDGFIKSAGMFICKECANDIYLEMAKRVVPKSPVSVFNKKIKGGAVSSEK